MDTWGGGWGFPPRPVVKPDPDGRPALRLYCDSCGGEDFDLGDDGFYYCIQCGSQSQDVVDTAVANEDICGADADDGPTAASASLYSLRLTRAKPLDAGPTQSQAKKEPEPAAVAPPERAHGFDGDEPSEPRDFGAQRVEAADPEAVAGEIRLRYVQGLQLMLQMQCEKLVEVFGVSPIICGLAGTVWLRYVAASKVFEQGWAKRVVAESEAAAAQHGKEEKPKPKLRRSKRRSEPHNLYGRKCSFIWIYSLRSTIPVYSSLAISFLVCYLAREAVLPTDIFDWALEGKLPYFAAFIELDRYFGKLSNDSRLSSRRLFRPVRAIGAWELEATAGSIAESIGLHIPSINFHAIAQRYLKELNLPVDKILPHACRLYEWSIPADLWLSSNVSGHPTYVCAMSILIVSIRILYNIHGQGVWEMSRCGSTNLSVMPEVGKRVGDADGNSDATSSLPDKSSSFLRTSEYNTEELLSTLEATFDKVNMRHDYTKNLQSYLKYCKDVVFVGLTMSGEEEKLIERLWNIYDKSEKDDSTIFYNGNAKRPRDVSLDTPLELQKSKEECQDILFASEGLAAKKNLKDGLSNNSASAIEEPSISNCFTSAGNTALEKMKLNMEENGFQYLPPRLQPKMNDYLHYKRQRSEGKYMFVAHADYFILLRACARLARVDARIMHLDVLKFERRLDWIEQRVGTSL